MDLLTMIYVIFGLFHMGNSGEYAFAAVFLVYYVSIYARLRQWRRAEPAAAADPISNTSAA